MKTKDAYFDFVVYELNQESIAPVNGGNTPFCKRWFAIREYNLINFLKLINTIILWLD